VSRWRAGVGGADSVRIRETQGSAMNIIDLQRRQPGPRAEQLLDRLQAAVAKEQRVVWNETGHARLSVAQKLEDARSTVSARRAELGDDWPDHIAIL
jgi:3-dehydroquinate dehydratase